MKFYRFPVSGVDVERVRAHASRQGWLIQTPLIMRAGFGAVADSLTFAGGLTKPIDVATLFSNVEVEGEGAPSGTGPLAFTSSTFERSGVFRAWLPEHVLSVNEWGEGWLTTTTNSPDAALRIIDHESLDGVATNYQISSSVLSPSLDGYSRSVAAAVEDIRNSELQKVVLARQIRGETNFDIDAAALASRLSCREPACTLFAVPALDPGRFVGASPELLVSAIDGSVDCHPLAGTIALPEESDSVDYAKWLMGSSKNLFEHRVVVDEIVQQLATRCLDVRAEPKPSVVILRSVAHLGTWIHGKIDPSNAVSAIELLALLHPTPAVGGVPQHQALKLIKQLEPEDRGLYAGAVGWFDADGNGEWWISIRAITVSGSTFVAWAGAGIVADSDPVAEREETRDKLASILAGLGEPATSIAG